MAAKQYTFHTEPTSKRHGNAKSNGKDKGKDMGKTENKRKTPHQSPLQRQQQRQQQQQQQQQQHPLAGVSSSDLYLLFPDEKSLDSFVRKIQSFKDDYMQATSTSRTMLHHHLTAARQREAEAIERARRLRAKEEGEAQRAFETVVLSTREQLEGLVLTAIKDILDASPPSPSPPPQLQQPNQGITAGSGLKDRHGHYPDADKAIERAHKARVSSKEQHSKDETGGREAQKAQGQGGYAAVITAKEEIPLVQQQQPTRTPTIFGWQFRKVHTNRPPKVVESHAPQSASSRQHGQDQEEARRESLKARLRQLVEFEERKMKERFATARSC
ncbi:hypothetical protein DFQ26_005757 [Actinomortierella ambigua]|nr:hypothetical protein DFQ26_005757 [Actinomortierella ambigua]